MSSIRVRRLTADKARTEQAFVDHPNITILKTTGSPPDRYQVEYRVRSLALKGESVVKRERHLAEIYLTTGYPRQAPQCRMLTPAFHPNIDPNAICVGDHWAAGESLANLIVRIGEILAFQSYNTKSPLNGEAARWVDENRTLLPTDTTDLRPESLIEAESATIHAPVAPPPAPRRASDGVPKARLIRSDDARPRRKVASDGVPKARLIRSDSPPRRRTSASGEPPRGKLIRRTPAAPASGAAAAGSAPAKLPVVTCTCGRRYRPRRMRPFSCLACGERLDPAASA